MDAQKQTPDYVLSILLKNKIQYHNIYYYAYPQMFGSSSGPRGGMGCSALCTFTIEAYVCDDIGPTVFVCAGMYILEDEKFIPLKHKKGNWEKIELSSNSESKQLLCSKCKKPYVDCEHDYMDR